MSQVSRNKASFINEDLGQVERKLVSIESDVSVVNDPELTKKFSDVKNSVKAVRSYLSERLGGSKNGQ